MPRRAKELSARAVDAIKTPGLHAVGGSPGLHLQVSASGSRSWVARLTVGSRTNKLGKVVQHRRDFGLGSARVVTLAAARQAAIAHAAKVRSGEDPIAQRRTARAFAMTENAARMTFRKAAKEFISSMQSRWKDPKGVERRESWLETYTNPHIGDLLVGDIELPHILAVLKPIWETKTETAEKLMSLLRNVLDWASVHGHRKGKENPARFKGLLDKVLPPPSKFKKIRNHPALPIDRVPEFMQDLGSRDNISARALAVTILTALRTSEVARAEWSEIDMDAGMWVVPANRMKMGSEHRVPLSPECVKILRQQAASAPGRWVFPGARDNQSLSSGAMLELLKEMAYTDDKGQRITTHGFRSTFRDFTAERTNYPREVAEMALAHAIESKVEAAYRRGDLLEKRRALMSEWSTYCLNAA
jgi:integrase